MTIYFKAYPGKGERLEVTQHKDFVMVQLTLGEDQEPIVTTVKENRLYYPKPATVFSSGIRYFEFYKKLLPYTHIPKFNVIFSVDELLYTVPVDKLFFASGALKARPDSLGTTILVPVKELEDYLLYETKTKI